MRRRKQSGLDAVAALPWQAGVLLGVIAFWAVRYGAGWYFSHNGGPIAAQLGAGLGAGLLAPLAWMLLALCWLGAGASYSRRRQRARLLETHKDLDGIASLRWQEFERLVGEAFRRQGYTVEETGQGGADGGVDLVLRRAGHTTLVQCKRWRQRQVPVTTVREMWGLLAHHGADSVKIVCVGDFTPDAWRFAQGKEIELVSGEELVAIVRQVQAPPVSDPVAPTRIEPAFAREAVVSADAAPACPRCDRPMSRRTNRRDGTAFWGCNDFPRCRGTRTA